MSAEAEARIRKSLRITSERLYRSGLMKADAGDLSRAVQELDKAVRYNKYHQRARNLLGLTQFRMGEIGEALKQWGISEYLNPRRNRATYYLKEVQKSEQMVQQMSEAVLLYNEALSLARAGDTDFAITRLKKAVSESPTYVKAQLLLALCYIETSSYKAALSSLDAVAKIDPLNPEAMHYRLFIKEQQEDGVTDLTVDIQDLSRDIHGQRELTEVSVTDISRGEKRPALSGVSDMTRQIAAVIIGILLGIGAMSLLYVPERLSAMSDTVTEQTMTIQQMETENKDLKSGIESARDLLTRVESSGGTVTEVTLSEIRQLLKELPEAK